MRKDSGVALISVVISTMLLSVLIGGLLSAATRAKVINIRHIRNLDALQLAEAGVDFAIWEINYGGADFSTGDGWSGTNPMTNTIDDFQDSSGNVYGDVIVYVYDHGSDFVTVMADASVDPGISGPPISRQVYVKLEEHTIFDHALLAQDDIDVAGLGSIDSYDSSLGPYGGTNIGEDGDIITNSDDEQAIRVHGDVIVHGDATTGPGGTVAIIGTGGITGSIGDTAEEFIPPVVVPSGLQGLISQGDINTTMTLYTGDYKFDSINLTSSKTLTLDGDINLYLVGDPSLRTLANAQIIVTNGAVNIYFDGDINLEGLGILNTSSSPENLAFYGTQSVTSVNLAGVGQCYGVFYAPSASFSISGTSDVYGAIVGNDISVSGSASIHYDKELGGGGGGPTIGYDPYVWSEH
ncbi:MAG: hypothetical protein JW800_08150 [Candidatus Omnitrophica bacterium]|nr:hypothetical protein [Candidatus Omnitrophota bacterium]